MPQNVHDREGWLEAFPMGVIGYPALVNFTWLSSSWNFVTSIERLLPAHTEELEHANGNMLYTATDVGH